MSDKVSDPNGVEMNNLGNHRPKSVKDSPGPIPFHRPEIEDAAEFNAVLENAHHFSASTYIEAFASPPLDPIRCQQLGIEIRGNKSTGVIRSPGHVPNLFEPDRLNGLQTQVYLLDFETTPAVPDTSITLPDSLPDPGTVSSAPFTPPRLRVTKSAFNSLVKQFEIPIKFVEGIFQELIWDGSGCFVRKDSKTGRVERIDIFFRAEWGVGKYPQIAITTDLRKGIVTYLIVEAPEAVKRRIKEGKVADRPLAIAALVLDECLNEWKIKITECRKKLLFYESRSATATSASPNHRDQNATESLHRLSTETHQMVEHIADFEERCRFLRCAYHTYTDAIKENNENLDKKWTLDDANSVDDSLLHLISGADTCRRWALNYNARTHHYEMMLFHLAEQADGQVNERNMQTNLGLSVMAMVFLPGTFVAGVFSMAFFTGPSSKRLGLSWLWLYFVITATITAIVFIFWAWWKGRQGLTESQDLESGSSS